MFLSFTGKCSHTLNKVFILYWRVFYVGVFWELYHVQSNNVLTRWLLFWVCSDALVQITVDRRLTEDFQTKAIPEKVCWGGACGEVLRWCVCVCVLRWCVCWGGVRVEVVCVLRWCVCWGGVCVCVEVVCVVRWCAWRGGVRVHVCGEVSVWWHRISSE